MKHHKQPRQDDEESVPACTSDAVRVSTMAATMPAGLASAQSVKMAGYLDKRGKRLPTWKRYWFVLDGRLLLYFGSQFDYLNQLSPCRGSLNLGLVSGVRPAGSARASSPQLEIATRSQAVLLRAKDRVTQERWLQALLDAIQMHGSPASNASGTHFRYTSASLPQPSSKKTKSKENLVTATEEEGEDEATSRVLQRIKTLGNPSHGTLVGEILTTGKGSLRHVQTGSHKKVTPTTSRAGEIAAQLPTSAAVHRLLERRQQEQEEEVHVTTIQIEPADSENTVAIVKDDVEMQVENEVYVASPAVVKEEGEYEGLYEDVSAQNKDDDYATVEEMTNFEPSLPPRREEPRGKDEGTNLLTPTTSCNIKRKRSFLQRMLGTNKSKKQKSPYNKKNIPTIKVEEVEIEDIDDNATYETVDYEELIQNLKYNEDAQAADEAKEKEELQENKLEEPKVNLSEKIEPKSKDSEYVNIETIHQLKSQEKIPEQTSSSTVAKETNSCIIPIVENEITHTVTITVQNTSSYAPTESEESVIPKLPPRRTSSSNSIGANSVARPVSPWHDVPKNNESVLGKSKRTNSTELPKEHCDLHKTIINIAGNDEVQDKVKTENETTQESKLADQNDQTNSCILRTVLATEDSQLIEQICDNRCTLKHHSADELDLLLCQLTKITNSPIHSVSVSALEPLRRRRLGSDPDYDIPRPHNIYTTLEKQKRDKENETMEATRFLNEPDLYYARPLSEYLQELDRMSHIQEIRTTRANTALKKWLEEAPKLSPTAIEDDEEVAMITAISSETEQVQTAASVENPVNADDNLKQETNATDEENNCENITVEESFEQNSSQVLIENIESKAITKQEPETSNTEIEAENQGTPIKDGEIDESQADNTSDKICVEQLNSSEENNKTEEKLINEEAQEENIAEELPNKNEENNSQEISKQINEEKVCNEEISDVDKKEDISPQIDEPVREDSETKDESEVCCMKILGEFCLAQSEPQEEQSASDVTDSILSKQIPITEDANAEVEKTEIIIPEEMSQIIIEENSDQSEIKSQEEKSETNSTEENSEKSEIIFSQDTLEESKIVISDENSEQSESNSEQSEIIIQEAIIQFANETCISEEKTEHIISETISETGEMRDDNEKELKSTTNTLNEKNTDMQVQEVQLKNNDKEVPCTVSDVNKDEAELDNKQTHCIGEKVEDMRPQLLNDIEKTSQQTDNILINDSSVTDKIENNTVEADHSEENINESIISKLEILHDTSIKIEEETCEIVTRRGIRSSENIAHRLSFAKSDTELVFQETVHHLKTPFTSSTFEFAPEQD